MMKNSIFSYISTMYDNVLNRYYRSRLYNNNFTIITNTCIGGIIYHKLGLKFLSPTINLWMYDKDFYRFVNDLHHYIGQELRFVNVVGENTPVAWLDDVEIHFNHYHSANEAAEKWYARCKRINWDNIYIITSDRPHDNDVITNEDILSLDMSKISGDGVVVRGVAVFAVRDIPNCDYIVHLPEDSNRLPNEQPFVNAYMFDKTKLGRWRWETAWDWVHWLNTGKIKKK